MPLTRDYVNATIGFDKLSELCALPSKSLMRMFGSRGNPNAKNLFSVISALQKQEGVAFRVAA